MGWRVDPRLVWGGPNLESHRNQTRIMGNVVADVKLVVFRQVRDRLDMPQRDR